MLTARQATAPDLPTILDITNAAYAAFTVEHKQAPLPVTEDYAPRIAAGEVWLVATAGQDVALAVLEDAPDHVMIFSLAVLPAAQGGGIGRWMMEFAEQHARTLGVPEIRLYTNALMERNRHVYAQAGYLETGRRPNPFRRGWTIVDMAKRL